MYGYPSLCEDRFSGWVHMCKQRGSVSDRVLTSLGLIVKAPLALQANGVVPVHQTYFGVYVGVESDRRIKNGKISINTHFLCQLKLSSTPFFNLKNTDFRERNIDLLLHLVMHSLIASCMYPDWRSEPQPWHIKMTL